VVSRELQLNARLRHVLLAPGLLAPLLTNH
jgi:hypothetical protein